MTLTDNQLVLLSRAAQREDRGVEVPTTLKGATAEKSIRPMLDRDLIEDVPRTGDLPLWKEDDDGSPLALVITAKGLAAINVEAEQRGDHDEPVRQTNKRAKHHVNEPKRSGSTSTRDKAPSRDKGRRPVGGSARQAKPKVERCEPSASSKLGRVIAMLGRKAGASIADIVAATGWQPHTARAALSGLRKRRLEVTREKNRRGTSAYRIAKG